MLGTSKASLFFTLSHIFSCCLCDVGMNEFMRVCVCLCIDNKRLGASGVLPPGLGPDQSIVCQSAGTQTARLYTHSAEERGERDTTTEKRVCVRLQSS